MLVFEDEHLEGVWYPIIFFPVNGTVNFTLYPRTEHTKNTIVGGAFNKEYSDFVLAQNGILKGEWEDIRKRQKELIAKEAYWSEEYREITGQLAKTTDINIKHNLYKAIEVLEKTEKDLTPEALTIREESRKLNDQALQWKYDYIRKNISIVSYYLVWKDIQYGKDNMQTADLISSVYPLFASKYKDHVYTRMVGSELNAFIKIKPGEKYVDFTAQDLKGESFKLSDLIEGKVVLLDLWASWCGPCIAKTRTMIPVYEEFKDKGFSIIGVAREFNDSKALEKRLGLELFNWLNLVEMDDKNGIWNKYGITNAAGKMVLIGKDGKILAVDAYEDEVRKILSSIL